MRFVKVSESTVKVCESTGWKVSEHGLESVTL